MLTLALTPIPGHSVFLLLLQIALLLLVARGGASLSRLFGLPAVVGELAAGIVLGPSVFGHYVPGTFAMVFPQESSQFQLLETVGLLGMVLLLLLTGLETDLKLLRNLGKAALVASALGMLVPFATGFGLGLWMPDAFLAQPERRTIFAAFLATAMAISAMPVIAKILMDLDLTKRNIGLVILSAGVVDDTAGWLILSVIAGAATRGGQIQLSGVGLTVVSMTIFLLVVALVVYPVMRFALRLLATRFRSSDTDLVLIVAVTMLCAAATEKIGVHAVFGAFVVGTAFRQVPHLNHDSIHRLESFVFSILAPVFFGTVGLKVDLWTLAGGGGGWMLAIVLTIACVGKLLGCTVGGLWGGLGFWEAVSIAVAMNARGAMELVVATIGLSLGILTQQMFSIIVVVAVVTSFMAPIALRLTMRLVKMTREEKQRLLEEESRGAFDPAHLRVLVPTAGGPHALEAVRIALGLTGRSGNPVEVLHVDHASSPIERLLRLFGPSEAGRGLEEHLTAVRALGKGQPPAIRRIAGTSASRGIVEEASRGVDVVMLGASPGGVGGRILEEVVHEAPCHVAIVKAASARNGSYHRVFVPIDGSLVSRLAAEFALRFAETTNAELTLAFVAERRAAPSDPDQRPDELPDRARRSAGDRASAWSNPPPSDRASALAMDRASRFSDLPPDSVEYLARVSPAFRVSAIKPNVVHLDYDPSHSSTAAAIVEGKYDIVVLGAENRAVRKRLFFGYENQRIIDLQAVTTLILVPNFARIH